MDNRRHDVDLTAKLAKIGDLAAGNPDCADILQLLATAIERRERRVAEVPVRPIDDDTLLQQFDDGVPLIGADDLRAGMPAVTALAAELETVALERGLIEARRPDLAGLVAAEPAARRAAAGDVHAFLIAEAWKFVRRAWAVAYEGRFDGDRWQRRYCWVCGGEATFAMLAGEGGKRHLYCPSCDLAWPFSRVACPYCDTTSQEALSYFAIEGDPLHRVDVCDVCKRYVKVVDARELEQPPFLDIEDMLTAHLDVSAAQHGYRSCEGA